MLWVMMSLCCLVVAGCGIVPTGDPPVQGEARDGVTTNVLVRPQARPADVPEAQTAGPEPEMSIGTLGRTVASLGNASEPGLWLKTPLVKTERSGRVFYPETGKSVAVTLIPIDGPVTAGSRLSLAAMQALGAPLTGLPEIDVLAG